MRDKVSGQIQTHLSRATLVLVACGTFAACAGHAYSSNTVFVIPPTALPAMARDPGEALLLHGTVDGRMLLYVEQSQGARLASFDVTDPVHIKGKGSVHLDAAGPFDFVAPLGDSAELIQFRLDQREAVLNLPGIKVPTLMMVQGLTAPDPVTGSLGFDTRQTSDALPDSSPHQTIDPLIMYHLHFAFDVKEIRGHLTRADTGTTFIATESGLYVARRPAVEWIHQTMVIPPN
jgi:hypothetical protein